MSVILSIYRSITQGIYVRIDFHVFSHELNNLNWMAHKEVIFDSSFILHNNFNSYTQFTAVLLLVKVTFWIKPTYARTVHIQYETVKLCILYRAHFCLTEWAGHDDAYFSYTENATLSDIISTDKPKHVWNASIAKCFYKAKYRTSCWNKYWHGLWIWRTLNYCCTC